MKLNKQIISVTLASTMILSSTSMTFATGLDANNEEVAVVDTEQQLKEEQAVERLKQIISFVNQAEKTNLQEDIDVAKELVDTLSSGKAKSDLTNRLQLAKKDTNEVEEEEAVSEDVDNSEEEKDEPEDVNDTEEEKNDSENIENTKNEEDVSEDIDNVEQEEVESENVDNAEEEKNDSENVDNIVEEEKNDSEAIDNTEEDKVESEDVGNVEEEVKDTTLTEDINSLPALEDITVGDKGLIEKAINNYNNLSEGQLNSVAAKELDKLMKAQDVLRKLEAEQAKAAQLQQAISSVDKSEATISQEDVDAAKGLIEALPDGETKDSLINRLGIVEEEIKQIEIERARAAEELKQATSSVDKAEEIKSQEDLNASRKLVDALPEGEEKNTLINRLEVVQEHIDKVKADKLEAKEMTKEINTLPVAKDLTLKDKVAVDKAIDAYNKLTEDQKELVKAEDFNKLLAAEDIVNKLEKKANTKAADKVTKLIDSLDKSVNQKDITAKYIAQFDSIKEAYDSLNDDAKALVSESNLDKLEKVNDKVVETKERVKSVQDQIDALPKDNNMLGNGESIFEAKKAYEALSYKDKSFINKESKSLLNKTVKNFKSFTNKYYARLNKTIYEEKDLNKKQELLNKARENFEAVKDLEVNESEINNYQNSINKAEKQLQAARKKADRIEAKNLENLISDFTVTPSISEEVISKIETIRKDYNSLSDDAKKLVSEFNTSRLKQIEEKVSTVKASAKSVEDIIKALPENKDISKHGKAILESKKRYNAISDEAKDIMNKETKLSLDQAIEDFKSFNENDLSNLSDAVSKESDLEKKQELINLTQGNVNLVKELGIDEIESNHYQNLIIEAQKQINADDVNILIDSFDESINTRDITQEYVSKVKAAKIAYDALATGAKGLISETNIEKLEETNTKVDTAKEEAIDNTDKLIANISETDTISEKLVNEIKSARKAYNALNDDSKALISEDNVEKLKGLKDIETKIAYDDLSDRSEDFKSEELKTSFTKTIENFKILTKEDISELQDSISNAGSLQAKRTIVDEAPAKLERARELGMEEAEYNDYKAIIDESDKVVSELENKAVQLKEATIKAHNSVANLSDDITIEDKEAITTTRSLVNEALSLDSNVDIEGIEKLESAEAQYNDLREKSILNVMESLNEENTEAEVKSMLQLLSDTTSELDMNIVEDKSLSRYLNDFTETTIESVEDIKDVVTKVNETADLLEEAMEKAENAIITLPTIEDVKIEDRMEVVNAKALIESVKVFDKNAAIEGQEKIATLDTKVTELEQAKQVEVKINKLADLDKFTLKNKPAVEEALEEYKKLTIYQQNLVGNIDDLFSVNSELEQESLKFEQAMEALSRAEESNSEKDIAISKTLIKILSHEEDKEALISKLNVVQDQINKTEDRKTISEIKSNLKFNTQMNDIIAKPGENDGVKFTLDVSNVRGSGLSRNAEVNSNGDIEITREQGSSLTFDMIITMEKGAAKDTKVFNVTAKGKWWPANSITTIKAQN